MKPWLRRCALVLSFAAVCCFAVAQRGETRSQSPSEDQTEVRLPNGKVQRDEILKAEHEQNLKDAAQLADLAEQLKQELEKNDLYILSVSSLKKIDEIEKLVKKIRSRLRHN
jgi:apolipoprotein N-acyltransferase